MKIIENGEFDEERAFYGTDGVLAKRCRFDGPADGESAFKECRNIIADECCFNLRYPFWHDECVELRECRMSESCRAALWYSKDIKINNSELHGVKALRECSNVRIMSSSIISSEFGWMSDKVTIENCRAEGEYFLFRGSEIKLYDIDFKGKYSFQYIENAEFEKCNFDTKDAFWHAKNVTVKDSVINGEYLAWYCENVTFENCLIIGTQPLCYCKNLKLIDCRMQKADLSFEKSDVYAELSSDIISIKNPASGKIIVPASNEIIIDDPNSRCQIIIGEKMQKCKVKCAF